MMMSNFQLDIFQTLQKNYLVISNMSRICNDYFAKNRAYSMHYSLSEGNVIELVKLK